MVKGLNIRLPLQLGRAAERSIRPPFQFGNCLDFDGVNDYASITVGPGATQLASGSYTEGTIAMWVNPAPIGSQANFDGMFSFGGASPFTNGVHFVTPNNEWTWRTDNTFSGTQFTFLPGVWTHYAFVWQNVGADYRKLIYINGQIASTQTIVGKNIVAPTAFFLGSLGASGGADTLVDEVWIFSRELKALEIRNLYNKGLGLANVELTGASAYYPLNESSGTVAVNALFPGKNLTLVNGPAFVPH
jgi:hypothetical protein